MYRIAWVSIMVAACSGHDAPPVDAPPHPWDTLGNHAAVYDDAGNLLPWTPWSDALAREMGWYAACPQTNGYPAFVSATFLDEQCQPTRSDVLPGTQDGLGILSYVQYYRMTGRSDASVLAAAQAMAMYILHEASTPADGMYPSFPRSTARATTFPNPADCGCESDRAYEIEPDKAGIVGYALLELAAETNDASLVDAAAHIATVLVANMRTGDATHSPWPFRADYRTGEARGDVSGNTSFILRLFDGLIARGHSELAAPRDALWTWIRDTQLPNLATGGSLWVQFFENHDELDDRTAWAPLNLARYLLERGAAIDADWRAHVDALLGFVDANFVGEVSGFVVCGEQDFDKFPWGGVLSTYAAVGAMYDRVTGDAKYRATAKAALDLLVYAIADSGCALDKPFAPGCGGWQQDAHFDKIHNFVDAIAAFPEWAQ
jgi:hypothetical protein